MIRTTRAGAAALATAETGDASLYWSYRSQLMIKQKEIYNKLSNNDLATRAEAYGAPSGTVATIRDSKDKDAFLEVTKSNSEKLEKDTGSVSSPRIIKDGKDIQLSNNWVEEVAGS